MGEIEENDPRERRRSRTVHRIGVTACLLLLGAALAGLLGKGPLSKVTVRGAAGQLEIEHYRFVHYEGPIGLKIKVSKDAVADGRIRFGLSQSFVEKVDIDRIDPQPESESIGAQFIQYEIRTETNAPAEIVIRFSPQHFGRLQFQVAVENVDKVYLSHFAFP